MKKYHVVLCVVVCLLATPQMRADEGGDDLEQIPSCGAVFPDTQIWQGPNYAKRVHGYSQSRRSLDGCFSRMRVEAWIEGVAMFPQIAEGYGIAVSTNFEVPVPFYMPYSAKGKHWLINFGLWLWAGWSHDDTVVVPPPQPPTDEDPQYVCEIIQQGRWIGGECQPPNSPLLFDRNGDGFHLTSADEGVLFDIDADGDLDQVAWTRADSGDAWLALDRNGNGVIDDATELFGNLPPGAGLRPQLRGFPHRPPRCHVSPVTPLDRQQPQRDLRAQ